MSFYNEELNHTFIHVPKTGGTSHERMPVVGGSGHAPARAINGGKRPKGFSWGFVRHPADRILSGWASVMNRPHDHVVGFNENFKEYVMDLPVCVCPHLCIHVVPMHEFLSIKKDIIVNFVGRFEKMNEDWDHVCKYIGIPKCKLHFLNISKHELWEDIFDKEMRESIFQAYERDFELFGYEI